MLIKSFHVFMTALFASLIMVPVLRRWALEKGEIDQPDNRKVHTGTIPRLGGIAIFMAFLFGNLIYVDIDPQVRGVLAGGLIIFFSGLVDDLYGLSPKQKFFGEIAGVAIAIAIGHLKISCLGDPFGLGKIILPDFVAIPFTVFALVGVINAINLIDGLDGLAGGISIISLIAFGVLAFRDNNVSALLICAGMLGALLGFLKYNFYPARIFMGDAGSLVLGFVLGCLAISLTQTGESTVSPIIPILILGVPILDTLWVMGRRILHGQSPFSPDRTHLHHKFLDIGLEHRFTVVVIYGITLFWSTMAIVFFNRSDSFLLWGYFGVSLFCYLVIRALVRHHKHYIFFHKDSQSSWRNSEVYSNVADFIDSLLPASMLILVLYLLTITLWGGRPISHLWEVSGVLFLCLGALLIFTKDSNNYFFLALFYSVGVLAIYVTEVNGNLLLPIGISLGKVDNIVFSVISFVVIMKILFRYEGEFFISTFDMLILGVSIFLGFFSYNLYFDINMSSVFLKGVIFLFAVKAIGFRSSYRNKIMVYSSLSMLLVLTIKGIYDTFRVL